MKKTKNAFTLIELLAVIVILAVIALIATPIILGIVEDAKKDAFLRSVELVISATDIDIANKTFEEEYTYEIIDGNISNLKVSVKNTDGMNGSVTYDIDGKEVYAIHNGVYCVKKTADMSKAEISDYVEDECTLIIENATPEACFAIEDLEGGGVTITEYYFYENGHYLNPECPKEVVIPSTINGKTVRAISAARYDGGEGFNYSGSFVMADITSIKFPSTLESIGSYAFWGNFWDSPLSGELDLSNTSLKNIDDRAFGGTPITSVKFPSTITSIGSEVFYNGPSITTVIFYGRSDLTGVSIGDSAFSWAEGYDETNGIHFVNE